MSSQPRVNELWSYIGQNQVNEQAVADMTNFKTSQVAYRLTCFDVGTNGVRYLKTLIYQLAANLDRHNWSRLRRIRGRELGNPYSITYDGEHVCLDYLRAVLDLAFIDRLVDLTGSRVLEVGAGYGRTCHTLLSNHDLESYTIIDLETTLAVSTKYLREVLDDDQFAKISFVGIDHIESAMDGSTFDLCINVDSMAEMDVDTVHYYLELISRYCQYFYVNNPVGKYMDESLDGHSRGNAAIARAMSPGLLTDIVDVGDNRAVERQVPAFLRLYRPHPSWRRLADEWAVPYTWYWQALYEKRDPSAACGSSERR